MIVASYKLERIPAAKTSNIKIIDVKADLKNALVDWLDGWDHGEASDKITDTAQIGKGQAENRTIIILFKLNRKQLYNNTILFKGAWTILVQVFGFKAQPNSFIITFSCLCLSGLRSSGTIIVYIHIRYTSYTLKRQPSSTVIGKQKVNRFFMKFF